MTDVKGRDLDTTFLYYGKEKLSKIGEYELRNHTFKARKNDKIPRGGKYCSPRELSMILPEGSLESLNKNFSNVQYIKTSEYLYWIYFIKSINIYKFKFLGKNISNDIVKDILGVRGYELAYRRKDIYDGEIEVWYNTETLILVIVEYTGGYVSSTRVHFKKFDTEGFITIGNTEMLFRKLTYQPVPLLDSYPSGNDSYWTVVIDIGTYKEKLDGKVVDDINDGIEYCSDINYQEMLKYIFNKGYNEN